MANFAALPPLFFYALPYPCVFRIYAVQIKQTLHRHLKERETDADL